jgi:diadenosine tetraphosphatase ApaH/serine/threonine PP2A family protein phosphatase
MSTHRDDTLETPARVALISDVHGNLPALEAVLADIRRCELAAIWCLGDLVGYGGEPNECVALAAEAADVCLVGNHDLVVLGQLDIGAFSPGAAAAARWTQATLADEARAFMSGLSPLDESLPIGLYHASPRDPVWEYVLSPLPAERCIERMRARVGAIGHSHVALSFTCPDHGRTVGRQREAREQADLSEGRWLLNPGAVGQPRDGDPRAAWLELDVGAASACWHRVEYDVESAAEAIRDAGLPHSLADRLYYGQ